MKTVYIDESGYTGGDLLNKDQPFQAASAICISEEDSKEVINKYFPNTQLTELKYQSLARRKNNWEKLLFLQKELLENFDCLTYICDKKFVLILHYIDYAVEPFYYDRGVNLYEDGANYSLASLVYYTAETMLGKKNFNDLLVIFQHSMKHKTDVSITALIEKIKNIKWKEFAECFGPMALATPSCIDAIKTKGVSTDAAFIVLLSLIHRLEEASKSDYKIVHDRSKNLEQYNKLLNKMISHKDHAIFRTSKIATLRFPLNLKHVQQVDSKESLGVQLSDILVGGIIDSAKALTGKKVNKYNKEIIKLYRDDQIIHLFPNMDFEAQKEFRRNTQGNDLINYFAQNFS